MCSLPALAQIDDLIHMTLPGPIRGKHSQTVGGGALCPWHSLLHYLAALCVSHCMSSATQLQNLLHVG